jgi:hypothetical protein
VKLSMMLSLAGGFNDGLDRPTIQGLCLKNPSRLRRGPGGAMRPLFDQSLEDVRGSQNAGRQVLHGGRPSEVFAAANRSLLARLHYTSHIPCNGVEEPKTKVGALQH